MIENHFFDFFLVGLGAIPGALMRWQINNDVFSNILGAVFLGFLAGFQFNSKVQILLSIGFCGAFTTFSGWMMDVLQLIRTGFLLNAFGLVALTLLGGFLALFIGFLMGKKIKHSFQP